MRRVHDAAAGRAVSRAACADERAYARSVRATRGEAALRPVQARLGARGSAGARHAARRQQGMQQQCWCVRSSYGSRAARAAQRPRDEVTARAWLK